MTQAKLIAGLILLALIIVVFLQNGDPVQFHFLFFNPMIIPKTVLILGSALLGCFFTLLAQVMLRRRKRLNTVLPVPTPPS